MVGYFDLDLPQDRDDLLGTVLLPRHAPAPFVPVSLPFALVQTLPVTSTPTSVFVSSFPWACLNRFLVSPKFPLT